MLGVRKVVWAQRPVKWCKGLGQPWLGVDPREKQDNPTKVALPSSAVFTQPCYWFCIAFCSAAWEPERRSRNWRGSRIQDWHICLGGSLSGRPGSDGRLFCLADGRLGAGQGVRVDRSWLVVWVPLPLLAQVIQHVLCNKNPYRGRRTWNKANRGFKSRHHPRSPNELRASSNVLNNLLVSIFCSESWGY